MRGPQDSLNRGIAMLHSFWYVAAVNEFENVRRSDSGCTMADWGIATANMLNALAGQGAGPV